MSAGGWHGSLAAGAASLWRLAGATPPSAIPPSSTNQEGADDELLRETLRQLKRLGAACKQFDVQEDTCARRIRVMLFEPKSPRTSASSADRAPCAVVYCPSLSTGGLLGADTLPLARLMLPLQVAVFCLDVDASGTTTDCEPEDLRSAVDFVRSPAGGSYQRVAVWGRSSGAAVALRCAANDPTLAALVCDSAFEDVSSMTDLQQWVASSLHSMKRLADAVPSVSCSTADSAYVDGAEDSPAADAHHDGRTSDVDGCIMRSDVSSLSEVAAQSFVPAFFLHGEADTVMALTQARALQESYGGERQLVVVKDGTHNSRRPINVIAKAGLFLHRAFRNEDSERDPEVLAAVERLVSMATGTASSVLFSPSDASDSEIRRLLRVDASGDERRRGLLLAALATCPIHRATHFNRVPLPPCADEETCELSGGRCSSARTVRMVASVCLPSVESEVIIASAAVAPIASCDSQGEVHFVVISCSAVSITRVVLSRPASGSSVGRGFCWQGHHEGALQSAAGRAVVREVGGLLARLETLAVQQVQLAAGPSFRQVDLSVSTRGGIRLKMGSAEVLQCISPRGSSDCEFRGKAGPICQKHADEPCEVSLWHAVACNVTVGGRVSEIDPCIHVSFVEIRGGEQRHVAQAQGGSCMEQMQHKVLHASKKSSAQGAVASTQPLFRHWADSSPASTAVSAAVPSLVAGGSLLTSSSFVTHGGPTAVSLTFSDESCDTPTAARLVSVGSAASGQQVVQQFATGSRLQKSGIPPLAPGARADQVNEAIALVGTLPISAAQWGVAAEPWVQMQPASPPPLPSPATSLIAEQAVGEPAAAFVPPPWVSGRHTWPLAEREAATSSLALPRPSTWAAPGALL